MASYGAWGLGRRPRRRGRNANSVAAEYQWMRNTVRIAASGWNEGEKNIVRDVGLPPEFTGKRREA